ncbi:MAG TPA: hypothetical protein DHV36_16005 [Desulfobacteraceae bacterium]|nr:hypothetical protein [Desulfobacteraceae bacterium]
MNTTSPVSNTGPDNHPVVRTSLSVAVNFSELVEKIQMSSSKPAILDAAQATFDQANGTWQPAMAYQWFDYSACDSGKTGTIIAPLTRHRLNVDLGHSGRFISKASKVLAAVYTAGPELDKAAAAASCTGDFLGSHFLDTLGLLVLSKVETLVKLVAERTAAAAGWGVSPFLSPGSVHGWELSGQADLAGLLPISDIGVTVSEAAVFTPFKTISCLIGIGPEFDAPTVGSTCRICAKRKDCQMRQTD